MSTGWIQAGVAVYGAYKGSQSGKGGAAGAADALTQQQADIAKEQWDDYKTTYQPLEHSMVADAQNYDTPAAYDKAAAQAQATTSQQIGLAQDRLSRTPGVDPSSAAAQAGQAKLALQGAALGATSANAARTNVQNTAWARKMDALGLGKGLVTNASAGLASASNATLANGQAAAGQASNVGSAIAGLGQQAISAYKNYSSPQSFSGGSGLGSSSITPVSTAGPAMPDLSSGFVNFISG